MPKQRKLAVQVSPETWRRLKVLRGLVQQERGAFVSLGGTVAEAVGAALSARAPSGGYREQGAGEIVRPAAPDGAEGASWRERVGGT